MLIYPAKKAIWSIISQKSLTSLHFSLKNNINHYKRVGYSMGIIGQSACQVIKTITVYSYVFLFNCMMVGQA